MDYMPIFTRLVDKRCLIVGGGEIALRKVKLLLDAGANIRVVAITAIDELVRYANEGRIELELCAYETRHIEDVDLVIAATNIRDVNQAVTEDANAHRLFINVVDDGKRSTFIVPGIIDRGPLGIAVGTSGTAPVLARLLRGKLEAAIPSGYGDLTLLAKKFRQKVKDTIPTGTQRKAFWEDVFEGGVAEEVFAGRMDAAEERFLEKLEGFEKSEHSTGEVYLVGAGPGAPDLLTFRAIRLMEKADVAVYDRLVSKEIMNRVRRDATRIYVGKERDKHCVPQDEINSLLVKLAKEGKRVVRVKGGDPYIFGRGGEEAQALMEAGIPFQVVPGITAAAATSAYCGIPLTHRDYSQSVTFATGHLKNGELSLSWPALTQSRSTLVLYMALKSLRQIAVKLIEHGRSADTPVALVQDATGSNQKVVTGDLTDIADLAESNNIVSPAIVIVGEVVDLYGKLNATTA